MNIEHAHRRPLPPPLVVVREALKARKPQLEPVIVPMPEANAAARALGGCIGCLEGEKLAIGLQERCSGSIVALAVCSSPSPKDLVDQHTLEVRCILVAENVAANSQALWSALELKAGQRGYRRLVLRGANAVAPSPAWGTGWSRLRACGVCRFDRRLIPGAIWVKVIRGERR